MALGGYKFAGFYCQRGSVTDVQWALLIHKTKVNAFLAASTLSSSGWSVDMADSPDGNYHCLDTEGRNYVTVFKRTNNDSTITWFALYTLSRQTETGTDTNAVKRKLMSGKFVKSSSSTTFWIGCYACAFYRIGNTQISYDDNLLNVADSNVTSTPLMPMFNTSSASNYNASSYLGGSSIFSKSSNYYGFAIKDDSIVMIGGYGASTSTLYCSLASGHAFSSFANENDNNGVVAFNFQYTGAGATWDELSDRAISGIQMPVTVCQNYSGVICIPAYFYGVPISSWGSSIESVPYQAISVYGTNSAIYGKGYLKIDLICMNMPAQSYRLPDIFATAAGGNLLCVLKNTSGVTYDSWNYAFSITDCSSPVYYPAVFVGWDSTNPDITSSSAWSEYTG